MFFYFYLAFYLLIRTFEHSSKELSFEKAKKILLFAHLFVPLHPK